MVELDGVPQSFGVILPNLNEVTGDLRPFVSVWPAPASCHDQGPQLCLGAACPVWYPRALHRKAAGGAVILAFIEEMRQRSKSRSFEHVEFGWVLEDNFGMRRPIELSGAQIDKIHRIYEKSLAA